MVANGLTPTEQPSKGPAWTPLPGPQTAAYNSMADIVGYGGSAGSGKTDMLLGIAGTLQRRSLILRRIFPSVRAIIERSREIFNAVEASHAKDSYNESLHLWRLTSGRTIEFGSLQYEEDKRKYQGRPYDYYGFDELTEFSESQFRFVTAWNRSTYVDKVTSQPQRCRIVTTMNPPLDEAGEWTVRFFAPWLDEKHPHPAVDGELRWYAMVEGCEQEVLESELHWYVIQGSEFQRVDSGLAIPNDGGWLIPVRGLEYKSKIITAKSRTFFHAFLKDNPYLEARGYGATIDALPEPLRSALKGKFNVARVSDPWQVLPTEWVKAAQDRWMQTEKPDVALRAVGNDVAHGGADNTVLALLYGAWFDELLIYPGHMTPRGEDVANYVQAVTAKDTPIFVDAIGYGASAYDTMLAWGMSAEAVNFGAHSDALDKSGRFRFANIRAEAYWTLREALDPDSGENLCLPPDRELLTDLCAPKYKILSGKIQIEPKEDIKARIGHSPDKGDAVVLAWWGAVNQREHGGIHI